MSAITDFVFKKNQLQQNAGQNTMDNIFKVANLGKDIWGTLQENKRNTENNTQASYRLNQEAGLKEAEAKLTFVRDQALAANNVSAARDAAENLATVQTALEKLRGGFALDVARINAGRTKKDRESMMTDQITKALQTLTTLRPDWTVIDPTTGQGKLDIGKHKDDIYKAVLGYFTDPEEQKWVRQQLDNTLGTQAKASATISGLNVPGAVNSAKSAAGNLYGASMIPGLGVAGWGAAPLIGAGIGAAVVPAGIGYGAYEGLKAATGGKTAIPGFESFKQNIPGAAQSIIDYLKGKKKPQPNPNGVRALK
jgi:hypothetical protein